MQAEQRQTFLKVDSAPSGQHGLDLICPVYGPFHLLPTGAGPQNSGNFKASSYSWVDGKEDKRTRLVQVVVVLNTLSLLYTVRHQKSHFYIPCNCANQFINLWIQSYLWIQRYFKC